MEDLKIFTTKTSPWEDQTSMTLSFDLQCELAVLPLIKMSQQFISHCIQSRTQVFPWVWRPQQPTSVHLWHCLFLSKGAPFPPPLLSPALVCMAVSFLSFKLCVPKPLTILDPSSPLVSPEHHPLLNALAGCSMWCIYFNHSVCSLAIPAL